MPTILPIFPPISSIFLNGRTRNSSPPAHNSTAAGTSTKRHPKITATTKTKAKTQPQEDDYHATLKALNSKGRTPRKSLGQHYMLNSSINEQLAAAADVKGGDLVLEIGPGTGSLTNVLVDSGATVIAIEKDPYMAELVRERFASVDKVKVLQEDFTRCHVRSHMLSYLEKSSLDRSSRYAKVVSNLPFNISTDVVKLLLPMGDIFSEVVLLLQEEAALRLVDPSLRTSEYRPINIFINFYSDPEYKLNVPRANFFPQPKVDAAVVAFRLKQVVDYPVVVSSTKSFFSMVNSAFNGKRKMLRKSLQHICSSSEIEEVLRSIDLPPTSRPEELTIEDFVRLHSMIVKE